MPGVKLDSPLLYQPKDASQVHRMVWDLCKPEFAHRWGEDTFRLVVWLLEKEFFLGHPVLMSDAELVEDGAAESEAQLRRLRAKVIASGWLWYEPRFRRDQGRHEVNAPKDGDERVYFILNRISGRIKIGKSFDVDKRLASLQTASPDPLELLGSVPSWLHTEAELHARFAALREHGEWFRDDPELLAFIEEAI